MYKIPATWIHGGDGFNIPLVLFKYYYILCGKFRQMGVVHLSNFSLDSRRILIFGGLLGAGLGFTSDSIEPKTCTVAIKVLGSPHTTLVKSQFQSDSMVVCGLDLWKLEGGAHDDSLVLGFRVLFLQK